MTRCVNFDGICPGEVPDHKVGTICPECALDQGLFVEQGLRRYKCAAEGCDGRVTNYLEGTVCPVCHRDQHEKYIYRRDVFCHTWSSRRGPVGRLKMPRNRYYYHWTRKENLPGILRDGLVPCIGKCYRDHYEEFNLRRPGEAREIYPCVFLAPTPRIYFGEVLLRVRRDLLDRDALEPDIVMGRRRRCVRYRKAIPAAWVEVRGQLLDRNDVETVRW